MPITSGGRDPSLSEWRALYDAALKFRELAPWKWMTDDQLFAVRDPESQEVGYCSVLGELDEVYALSVYPGPQGLYTYLRMEANGPGSGYRDMRLYLRCIMAEFEDRSALEPKDAKVLKALGLRTRGRKSAPMFRTHEPFKHPWFLNATEARFMTVMLEQAWDVCSRAKVDDSLIIVDEEAPLLTRVRPDSILDVPWEDQRSPFPASPEEQLFVVRPDPFDLARIKAQVSKGRGTWEIDFGCAPFPLQEVRGERPVYPLILMIVDHDSGMVLSMDLEKSVEGEAALLQLFLSRVRTSLAIPRKLLFANPAVFTYFEEVARGLGIKMELQDRLPAMDAAYDALAGDLARDAEPLA